MAAIVLFLLAADADLHGLPANRWVRLPDGPANPHANPVWDPRRAELIALLAGGNGTAHLDPVTGRWRMVLEPNKAQLGGDQPLMKEYALHDGRPDYSNMHLFHMTAYDDRRDRIVAGATTFMAAYDPARGAWTDLGATVDLFGRRYPGVPPVAWGSMCLDPINDEIVLFPGGAVYNFDAWEKDREVTGHFGTSIYSPASNVWTRPQIGPAAFYKARDLLRAARIALQDAMSESGEAIVRERRGESFDLAAILEGQHRAALRIEEAARAIEILGDHPRLAAGARRIRAAARILRPGGGIDDIYRAHFDALQVLLAANEEDLWSEPHPRMLSRMVYLPDRKAILLFGGTDGHQFLNDTWLYDCAKREWIRMSPKTHPRPRAMHVLAYHPRLGRAVLAGGYTDPWAKPEEALREVWTYDAKEDEWTLVLEDFPFKPGCASYYGEYCPPIDAIVLLRDGKETFALRLEPGPPIDAPACDAYPKPGDTEPFIPPRDDPGVVARWEALPPDTWVPADPPWEPREHGWGMMGFNGRLGAAMMWGGGHSSHQANEITLYFPGANRWVVAYPPHRIDIPPWNKACGNPGGVDIRGGVHNLHARNGLAGNGTRALISIQCFSPYWYGPEAMLRQPLRWGRTTLFTFDMFSRRWRMPLPSVPATGMCYPYNAGDSVMAVDHTGSRYFDHAADDWHIVLALDGPKHVTGGEGTGPGYLYIEKRNMVVAVGPPDGAQEGPIETWFLDLAGGSWKRQESAGAPPGRPAGMAYCEADDSIFAACFTGWDRKTQEGQEAVYSFAEGAWRTIETRVRQRHPKSGRHPLGLRAYHGAWAKIAYSPRHNLLLNFQEDGGMWVMRPAFRPVAGAEEGSPEILRSWEDDYAAMKAAIARRDNPHARLREGADRRDVASIHSLAWDRDRTPADVALRRTEALLEHLKTLPDAPDVASLESRLDEARSRNAAGADEKDVYMTVRRIGRAAMRANPLMDFDELIFNRWTSSYGHVQEAWARSVRRGGGLYVLSGLKTGKTVVRNLLEESRFENGPFRGERFLDVGEAVRSFDLSFDGKKAVFAWVQPSPRALKIASVNIDGSGLRQLTRGPYDDLDPVWLPDGRIVFVSTRVELTVRCNFGPATPQAVMHAMEADGSDQVRISFHETNERYPSVDNDGRLIYMRWDYIDRDFSAAHHLWVCNPDGRDPRSFHGNYPEPNVRGDSPRDGRGDRPFAEYFMRAVPGSPKYMAIASTHHAPPYGIPILIDPTVRDDNKVSQVKVIVPQGLPFPSECGRYTKRGLYQGISFVRIKDDCAYFDPWPLSETFYLVPWGPIVGEAGGGLQENFTQVPMKLYLVDAFGDRELLSDCNLAGGGYYLSARPLRPRTPPPVIPTLTFQGRREGLPEHKRATIFVADVRRSDFAWPPGIRIKRMRIVQVFPRPWSSPNVEAPFTGWSEGGICRASLGTVPVEDDGSVWCEAPVERAILFQLLDEKGMAVQTMRSLTYVHPGEQLSCAGCHEDKWTAVRPPPAVPLAARRAPSVLEPDAGGPAPVTFGLVRPVFQNSCVPCHRERGEPPFSFEYNMPAPAFPDPRGTSRLSDYCYWFDASNNNDGLGPYGGYRSTPLEFGFARSRMGKALLATHGEWIAPDDLHRIMLWLDLNAMRLGTPTLDPDEVRAQETGVGSFRWPPEMDPANPTGVEKDRPVPGRAR